ncbi:hypothetical protein Pint_36731 [Pistacia integerrima]|nr:hypothetical protein Pint_36731 [Pistacia integerrima]
MRRQKKCFQVPQISVFFFSPQYSVSSAIFPAIKVLQSIPVNCGGPQITSSNNIVYEMHNETLSPAKYYVISTASASSLRYYGLGLENGNYTLTLQFAEIADLDTTGRRSLGNGEGIHVEKDFDITRVADRIPRKAVQRIYTAQVSENYMEIHFFGAGKGTCCMPNDDSYGPLISAISAAPDFEPTVRPPGG